jgi:hypothetical protein
MQDLLDRLGAVNPLIWVVSAIAAVMGYGAKKLVALMRIPEEKQQKVVIILKASSMVLAILVLVFLMIQG